MLGAPADRTGNPTASPSEAVRAAAAILGDLAQIDVPIGPLTTYRVGGRAALFVQVGRLDDLAVLANAVQVSGLPVHVLGRGSNLLVADAGFEGIVVSTTALTDRFEIDAHSGIVRAGASVALPVLARQTAARALTGFEWAVGVPGSIGGGQASAAICPAATPSRPRRSSGSPGSSGRRPAGAAARSSPRRYGPR